MVVTFYWHLCGSETFERDWRRRATGLAAFLRPSGALGLSTFLYHGLAPVATCLRPNRGCLVGVAEPPFQTPLAQGGKSGGERYAKGENALALVVRLRERHGLVESCRGGCRDSPLENGLMGVSLGRGSTRFVAVMA